jgi:hypothetical protein
VFISLRPPIPFPPVTHCSYEYIPCTYSYREGERSGR